MVERQVQLVQVLVLEHLEPTEPWEWDLSRYARILEMITDL